jgi:hypothetical protein
VCRSVYALRGCNCRTSTVLISMYLGTLGPMVELVQAPAEGYMLFLVPSSKRLPLLACAAGLLNPGDIRVSITAVDELADEQPQEPPYLELENATAVPEITLRDYRPVQIGPAGPAAGCTERSMLAAAAGMGERRVERSEDDTASRDAGRSKPASQQQAQDLCSGPG